MTGLWIMCIILCTGMTHACLRTSTSGSGNLSGTSSSGSSGSSTGSDAGGDDTSTGTDDENGSDNSNTETQLPGCPTIVTRAEWGARSPRNTPTRMSGTPSYAVIHHGAGSRCFTEDECKEKVRGYQNYHMDTNRWADIGYNFIIGEDGNVYEGRGWGIRGAHAGSKQQNDRSLGICVIGDFSSTAPSSAAQDAILQLLSCAEANEKISSSYTVRGHRDLKSTSCPGQTLYNIIKTWDRYSSGVESYDSGSSLSSTSAQSSACPNIISRAEWGARAPKSRSMMTLVPTFAVIHHGAGARCDTKSACTNIVKSYQNLHMDTNGWADIGYNFIVGEDGNVYEGRGWGVNGAHAGKTYYNRNSLGICVIGDFSSAIPNDAAQNAVKQLLSCAVKNKKLSSAYKLHGHRDVKPSTVCPGQSFYNLIQTWNAY